MKLIYSLFILLVFDSCANAKEKTFVGSTPANEVVKYFLGIPLSDSVDFIRWWVTVNDDKYTLKCNYGIGKPNTSGFWNGGKWINLKGSLKEEKNYFYFQSGNKVLKALELNPSLLHLSDDNKNLLVGTGGWGYTLNNEKSSATDDVNIISEQTALKDSMSFQGRTPCGDFSINHPSPNCIKMKWYIVLYANAEKNEPTTYLMNRSRLMPLEYPGKTGTWKIVKGKDGRIIYELTPDNENSPTYLLKLDDNILVFTDSKGNLLVGDKDFGFTLSRKF